jgi:hypothetical protein
MRVIHKVSFPGAVYRNKTQFHGNIYYDREAEKVVTQWFQSQAADFYDTGIKMLVPRYDKCLNSGGDYVENS